MAVSSVQRFCPNTLYSVTFLSLSLYARPGMEADCTSSPAWLLGCCYHDQPPTLSPDPSSSIGQEHAQPQTNSEKCTDAKGAASPGAESKSRCFTRPSDPAELQASWRCSGVCGGLVRQDSRHVSQRYCTLLIRWMSHAG